MKKAQDAKERIAKLRAVINHHKELYHTQDKPSISDEAYDALVKELVLLEEEYLGQKSSVTESVGTTPSAAFSKVKHKLPQWSFDNVFDNQELVAWDKKLKRHLAKEGLTVEEIEYVVEHKIDGLKLVIEYESGILVRAQTRGDGVFGEDVTHTARTISTLPQKLNYQVDLICVGEVWMGKAEFVELNKSEIANGKELFANPRNAAAGSLRQLDPAVALERKLSLYVYDIDLIEVGQTKLKQPTSQWDELEILKRLGLPTNPYPQVCQSISEIDDFYQAWKLKTENLPYGVDGIVIKANEIKIQLAGGYTAKSPRFGVAYKFPAVETTTVVEAIDLQVGRTGVVTPVAHLQAVLVDGSTVTRATLHNEDQIKRLDVRVGDTVVLRKAGDVIPEIVSVIKDLRVEKSKPYVFPKQVAACGGDGSIERVPGSAAYRCVYLDSDFLRRQKMYYFVSKNALNFDGVGPKIIDALLDNELISDVSDLFTLKAEEVISLPGFKQKSANNVIESIASARRTSLTRLLVGLSIENVGEETARLLAINFKTITAIKAATLEALIAIDGIGEVVAQNIINWQTSKKEQDLLARLLEYLEIANDETVEGTGSLSGMSFVFTGTLTQLSRDDAAELARKRGAGVSNSVSSKTSYVVAGLKPGSKAAEATKLGVKIIDEQAFLSLIA